MNLSAICAARTALPSGAIRSSAAILWRYAQRRFRLRTQHRSGGLESGESANRAAAGQELRESGMGQAGLMEGTWNGFEPTLLGNTSSHVAFAL
jgi:hypothetical protein